MDRARLWLLILGLILLLNAAFMLLRAGGRIDGYVGGLLCAGPGILSLVFASRPRSRAGERDDGRDATHGAADE